MSEKIIAVTVTYNRINTFTRTLESLINQEYQLEKIIVVDNNSNENSKNELKKIADSKKDIIEVLWEKENLGGAGGFYKGMKHAFEKYNSDWIWIMDDDAYPRKDCLKNMIHSLEELEATEKKLGFVAPVIYGIDNQEYQMYHHKYISKYKDSDMAVENSYEKLNKFTKIEADAFVGPMFPRKIIEEFGFPDKDLFIYGDDVEYTYRISRDKNCYLIKDAIIDHQDQPATDLNKIFPKTWWKDYYMFRNKFLFIDKYSKNFFQKCIGKIKIINIILLRIIAAITKKKYKKYRKIRVKLLLQALNDGLKLKKGVIVNVANYIADINKIV